MTAPAIRYPVQRSVRLGCVLAVLVCMVFVVVLAWVQRGAGSLRWPAVMAVMLCVGVALAVCRWWWLLPQGWLRWDGLQWEWQSASGVVQALSWPEVQLDLQSALLLRVHSVARHGAIWLWLECPWSVASPAWLAVRRAVFLSVRPVVDPPASL